MSGLQHPFSGSGTIWADGVRKTEAISAILGGNGDGICETEERLKDTIWKALAYSSGRAAGDMGSPDGT